MKELSEEADWISEAGQCERPGLTFDPPSTFSFYPSLPLLLPSLPFPSFDLSVASGPVLPSHIHLVLILSISRCFWAHRRPREYLANFSREN